MADFKNKVVYQNYPGREECLRPYEVLALYRRA